MTINISENRNSSLHLETQNDVNPHLQFIEENIESDILTLFKESGEIWNGDEQYTMLFKFWKKISSQRNTPIEFEVDMGYQTNQNPELIFHDSIENFVKRNY